MSTLEVIGVALAAAGAVTQIAARMHLLLHLLQLEHYERARLRVWVARRRERWPWLDLLMITAAGAVLVVSVLADIPLLTLIAGLIAGIALADRGLAVWHRDQVKPLVFTPRARRLFIAAVALSIAPLFALAAAAVFFSLDPAAALAFGAGWLLVAAVLAPEILGLAVLLSAPLQRADNARFVRRAKSRLAAIDPLVIGITGSYGKTTTKNCVDAVTGLIGPSYATPASFNSYLGVTRAINEGLQERHRTFIAEMGAYRRGDVAELCEFVSPRIGIVTAIGPAHLERFGSLEETAAAKGELAEALPAAGQLITRADDEWCRKIAERSQAPVTLFAPEPHPDATVWAEDVAFEEGRTRFQLCIAQGSGGETVRQPVRARLLGRHNVANLLAAAAVGVTLEMPDASVSRALSKVEPPEHRLSPIVNRAAGIVVIDDAYNANPAGAEAALEVLGAHPAERRILVTPGMIELGSSEREANREFGRLAAGSCDIAVLVGPRQAEPICQGLEEAGFPAQAIHVVADAKGAQELLATMTRRGDVVLFENDLPDLYLDSGRRSESDAGAAPAPA